LIAGCETVLTSKYSAIYGIPVALGGAVYYFAAFILIFLYKEMEQKILLRLFFLFSALAFFASLGFVYIQLFILKAICIYCMASAATSTLLFLLSCIMQNIKKSSSVDEAR